MTDQFWGPVPPTRHVAEGPAGGFAPTRSASPDAILAGRSRQWLGAVPAARVWAARRSLPCGGSVVLTNEPAKCRRSLTSRGRDGLLGQQLVTRGWLVALIGPRRCRDRDLLSTDGRVSHWGDHLASDALHHDRSAAPGHRQRRPVGLGSGPFRVPRQQGQPLWLPAHSRFPPRMLWPFFARSRASSLRRTSSSGSQTSTRG